MGAAGRVATGRDAVVVFDHAFPGRSLLTMTMTAKNQPYKHGVGPFGGSRVRCADAHRGYFRQCAALPAPAVDLR